MLEKSGYFASNFGCGCWGSFLSTFITLFYTSVAGIDPLTAATITSLATVWDAINDPLFASWADNHTFKNGDRMRPLLIYASVPLAACLVLMFTKFGTGAVAVAMAFTTYFLFRIPSTLHTLPMNAMRQLAASSDAERVNLGAWATLGGSIGMACASVTFLPLIHLIGGYDSTTDSIVNPSIGYPVAAGICGLVVIVTSFFNYFTTKERIHPEKSAKTSFVQAVKVILRLHDFRINLALTFFYGMFSTLVTTYAIYYCKYVLKNSNLVVPVTAMYIVGVVIAMPFVTPLFKKLGRNRLFAISSAILALGSAVFIVFAEKIFAPFVFCFAIGFGTEFASVLISVNKADITDIIEYEKSCRLDGMVVNVTNFIQKCASALLTFVLGLILQLTGFVSAENDEVVTQPREAIVAIMLIMGIGSLAASVGMWIASKFITIDRKFEKIKGDE